MKQIIASVFFDILSYIIENIIFCIFRNYELNLIKSDDTNIQLSKNWSKKNKIIILKKILLC